MSKNIVICCDGTGNEIASDLSNVLKLYRILKKDEGQIVFYDPGIGTIGQLNLWSKFLQNVKQVFCLGTGYGLDENVLDAYKFLIDVYEDGDKVFLFGFSRGAYTVRALAGFLHVVGLLRPEQKGLSDYALTAYKQISLHGSFEATDRFSEVTSAKKISIDFMGVWDTVSSVIVPRPDRFYIPSIQRLPYTARNPHVRVFRQAAAIDERRRMFRLNEWLEPQEYDPHYFDKSQKAPQDIKQVWFSGVHADVGGGYPETESALAKYPLAWMIREAQQFGLKVTTSMLNHLVLGRARKGGRKTYVAPDSKGMQHNSLSGLWHLCEVLPKFTRFPEWPHCCRIGKISIYFPFGESRRIPEGALIHSSVFDRKKELPSYQPKNLPSKYEVINDDEEYENAL